MRRYMKKSNNKNKSTLLTIETAESFFERGRKTAAFLDQKKSVAPRRMISFEDTADLVNFLTNNKLKLVTTVRKHPNSISKLADILHRTRASVDNDVKALEAVGILKSEYVCNPGHGVHRIITAADKNPVILQVQASL